MGLNITGFRVWGSGFRVWGLMYRISLVSGLEGHMTKSMKPLIITSPQWIRWCRFHVLQCIAAWSVSILTYPPIPWPVNVDCQEGDKLKEPSHATDLSCRPYALSRRLILVPKDLPQPKLKSKSPSNTEETCHGSQLWCKVHTLTPDTRNSRPFSRA